FVDRHSTQTSGPRLPVQTTPRRAARVPRNAPAWLLAPHRWSGAPLGTNHGRVQSFTFTGVDPRTFLRPRALQVLPAPRPGDRAPSWPVSVEPDRPAIVAFLRHTGCPFSERMMQLLREGAVRSPDVQWIAISHAPEQATARWCRVVGGTDGVRV